MTLGNNPQECMIKSSLQESRKTTMQQTKDLCWGNKDN